MQNEMQAELAQKNALIQGYHTQHVKSKTQVGKYKKYLEGLGNDYNTFNDTIRNQYNSAKQEKDTLIANLQTHKDEIVEKKLTKLGFTNAKFGKGGHPWAEQP